MKIVLNTDTHVVESIKKALRENEGYCPCSFIKSEDTKCMCKEFRESEEGYCHCELYQKIPE